jgi:hypothetical protein
MEGPLHIKLRGLYENSKLSAQAGYNLEELSSVKCRAGLINFHSDDDEGNARTRIECAWATVIKGVNRWRTEQRWPLKRLAFARLRGHLSFPSLPPNQSLLIEHHFAMYIQRIRYIEMVLADQRGLPGPDRKGQADVNIDCIFAL